MKTRLTLKVVPGSARDSIAGWYGSCLKIKVTAPPENGRANQALQQLLAAHLHMPLSAITVVSGQTSPHKVIEIHGLDEKTVFSRLSLK